MRSTFSQNSYNCEEVYKDKHTAGGLVFIVSLLRFENGRFMLMAEHPSVNLKRILYEVPFEVSLKKNITYEMMLHYLDL